MVDPRPLDLSHLLLSTWVVITLCLRRLHGFALALRHRIAAGGATFKLAAEVAEEPHVREKAGTPLIEVAEEPHVREKAGTPLILR